MISFRLVFSRRALEDVVEARVWYNQQQQGLGKKLVADVKDILTSVKQNPYFASIKFNNIRTASCKKFPYAIHYEIDEANRLIRIISIFHFSRRPYWIK